MRIPGKGALATGAGQGIGRLNCASRAMALTFRTASLDVSRLFRNALNLGKRQESSAPLRIHMGRATMSSSAGSSGKQSCQTTAMSAIFCAVMKFLSGNSSCVSLRSSVAHRPQVELAIYLGNASLNGASQGKTCFRAADYFNPPTVTARLPYGQSKFLDPQCPARGRGSFGRRARPEFHGSKMSADGGLLLFRELDDALGLHELMGENLVDTRAGHNRLHSVIGLARQSISDRFAGYEDVNDIHRPAWDPAMR